MTYAPLTHGLQPCYNQADWKLLESWETVENVWLLSEVMGDTKNNISCSKVYDVQTSDMWFHIVRGHWLYHLTMGTPHVLCTPVTHYFYSNSNIMQPWHGRTTSLALSQVPYPLSTRLVAQLPVLIYVWYCDWSSPMIAQPRVTQIAW